MCVCVCVCTYIMCMYVFRSSIPTLYALCRIFSV